MPDIVIYEIHLDAAQINKRIDSPTKRVINDKVTANKKVCIPNPITPIYVLTKT